MVVGIFSVWFFGKYDIAGLDFLFISALMGGFAMAVYVPVLLYMNLTRLPKSARPGWITSFYAAGLGYVRRIRWIYALLQGGRIAHGLGSGDLITIFCDVTWPRQPFGNPQSMCFRAAPMLLLSYS